MKNVSLIVFLVFLIVTSASAFAATTVTGGWGIPCQTNRITCSYTGRVMGCQVSGPVLRNQRSQCVTQTGSVGIVQCTLADRYGNLISNYYDKCP